MAERVRRCQDDHRAARSSDPSLRHRRNRKRQLAIQKPNLTTASRSLATALLGVALARVLLHPAHASPPLKSMADGGQNCTPIGGQFWKPIDSHVVPSTSAALLRASREFVQSVDEGV